MTEKRETISDEQAIAKADGWLAQKIFNEVKEEVYQRGTFTVFIIHAAAGGREYEGVGFAKARPDITIAQYKAEVGRNVAKGRSVYDLFQEYNKQKGT